VLSCMAVALPSAGYAAVGGVKCLLFELGPGPPIFGSDPQID